MRLRAQRPYPYRSEARTVQTMYIGLGTIVVILVIVVLVMLLRGR